jgi:hypothetical protein
LNDRSEWTANQVKWNVGGAVERLNYILKMLMLAVAVEAIYRDKFEDSKGEHTRQN